MWESENQDESPLMTTDNFHGIDRLEEFERFEALHGKAVWQEVLKERREAEGNPDWQPT
jgi:hypothetical protein